MTPSRFLDGVRQTPIRFGEHDLLFPNFVRDASLMTAVFPARYRALRRRLPDPRFVAARLAPGVGIVAVTAFEYRETSIGPYNEVALAIMLSEPGAGWNLPGAALLSQHRKRQYHAFVYQLPVTTELARRTGELMGFPKFVGSIDFDAERGACRLSEGGEPVLTLHGTRIPARRAEELQTFAHLWMDRQPQRVEVRINALELGDSLAPGAARLELSRSHPLATELAELLLSRRSIAYRFIPRLEAIEFDPERLNLALMAKGLESLQARAAAGATA